MLSRDRVLWAIVLAGLIFGALLVSIREKPLPEEPPIALPEEPSWPSTIPDFTIYNDVAEKKRAFFDFLQPMVEYHNRKLIAQRHEILKWQRLATQELELDGAERRAMLELAQRYRIAVDERSDKAVIEMLLRRVDVVPVSLALAQAATESGWGTSRFAVAGNNLFGIWCYKPGCGIVPRRRGSGAKHEVARFESPAHSVRSYFLNINTHPAYRSFRELRERLPAAGG